MNKNLYIYENVRSVPEAAKSKITGGRLNGKTDINPMWRIKMLTLQFGPCGIGWYYKAMKKWIETYNDEAAAFVDIELYIKVDGEWSMPICGTGGSMFAEKEKNGIHVSDECFKMATTDALSVACKQLGIGADVYWDKDKTKYSAEMQGKDISKEIKEKLKPVELELKRTGYSPVSICKTYKLDNIYEMSDLQIKDCLQRFKNLPDKGA